MCYIAKEGSTVRLKIPIIGKPTPKVSWKKGEDEDLTDTGRVCAESSSVNTTLLIRDCQRSDASKYTITLRNSAGSRESTIFIRYEFDCTRAFNARECNATCTIFPPTLDQC